MRRLRVYHEIGRLLQFLVILINPLAEWEELNIGFTVRGTEYEFLHSHLDDFINQTNYRLEVSIVDLFLMTYFQVLTDPNQLILFFPLFILGILILPCTLFY